MRVQNLTDKATPTLRQYGLVSMVLALGDVMVNPGESADVSAEILEGAHVRHWIDLGALKVEDAPKEMPRPAPPTPAPPKAKADKG